MSNQYQFATTSEVIDVGPGDDGQPIEAEAYYITATDERGRVYRYVPHINSTVSRHQLDRKVILQKLSKVIASFERRVTEDWTPEGNDHWEFHRFIYGSTAYQEDGGQLEELLWEKKVDHENSF